MNEPIPYIIYDLSLPLPERKEKALHFNTALKAAEYIGLTPNKIPGYCNPIEQKHFFSKKHNKFFAIRKKIV